MKGYIRMKTSVKKSRQWVFIYILINLRIDDVKILMFGMQLYGFLGQEQRSLV